MKAAFMFGTRPEIIKLCPVIQEAEKHHEIETEIIYTGQHYDYEMSEVFFNQLQLNEPDYFLEVGGVPRGEQISAIIARSSKLLERLNPDVLIVLGDTNSTAGGALAANMVDIPVAHIEAGCRSYDFRMPEEWNRRLVDSISTLLFAPSDMAQTNLLFEGHPEDTVVMAGNTIVDAIHAVENQLKEPDVDIQFDEYSVLTAHRAENVDSKESLKNLLQGVIGTGENIVFPIHPRTKKAIATFGLSHMVEKEESVVLTEPLGYFEFLYLLRESRMVFTDSGGIQEESAILQTPCITLRRTTEWPETVFAGMNKLVDVSPQQITRAHAEFSKQIEHEGKLGWTSPYVGQTAPRIAKILLEGNNLSPQPEFRSGMYPVPVLSSCEENIQTTIRFNKEGYPLTSRNDKESCHLKVGLVGKEKLGD